MDEAGSFVHGRKIRIKPPVKIPTPYGGRLIWTLPGKTKIVCHLKDKDKIRHKKRWSQCMYMYYLLGYKLMDTPYPGKICLYFCQLFVYISLQVWLVKNQVSEI